MAVSLAGPLAATARALRLGEIDVLRTRAIVEATTSLEDAAAQAVETRILPRAPEQTLGQLRSSLARAVLAADPTGAEARHEGAALDRRVVVTPLPDGMAELWALLPADAGARAMRRDLAVIARS